MQRIVRFFFAYKHSKPVRYAPHYSVQRYIACLKHRTISLFLIILYYVIFISMQRNWTKFIVNNFQVDVPRT